MVVLFPKQDRELEKRKEMDLRISDLISCRAALGLHKHRTSFRKNLFCPDNTITSLKGNPSTSTRPVISSFLDSLRGHEKSDPFPLRRKHLLNVLLWDLEKRGKPSTAPAPYPASTRFEL
ncbi:hypothetical protein C4D60_Mb00t00400 [Musa balbisiana]|uniref:Uncharacterized protein n=1 Tax=Musa balbisiana TaxID=52838 RepID=A0A4S8I7Z2_MUSBA|nr:hypothetical protein C4D60_Mb00t00400 [Musa balbisiana]